MVSGQRQMLRKARPGADPDAAVSVAARTRAAATSRQADADGDTADPRQQRHVIFPVAGVCATRPSRLSQAGSSERRAPAQPSRHRLRADPQVHLRPRAGKARAPATAQRRRNDQEAKQDQDSATEPAGVAIEKRAPGPGKSAAQHARSACWTGRSVAADADSDQQQEIAKRSRCRPGDPTAPCH